MITHILFKPKPKNKLPCRSNAFEQDWLGPTNLNNMTTILLKCLSH